MITMTTSGSTTLHDSSLLLYGTMFTTGKQLYLQQVEPLDDRALLTVESRIVFTPMPGGVMIGSIGYYED